MICRFFANDMKKTKQALIIFTAALLCMCAMTSIAEAAVTLTSYPIGNTTAVSITTDPSNNVYTANNAIGTVSKLTPSGVLTTLASGLGTPLSIAYDPTDGNLYVMDQGRLGNNNIVYKVNMTTGASTVFVTGFDTSGNGTRIMVFDSSGNLYIGNSNGVISKVTPAGAVSTFATIGAGIRVMFFDQSGNLYTSSTNVGTISKITPSGTVTTLASGLGQPVGFAFNSLGNLYVASQSGGIVYKVTPSGTVSTFATGFTTAYSLQVDASNNVYVGDMSVDDIVEITPSGVSTTLATYAANGVVEPIDMVFDSVGNLYVGSYSQILKFTLSNCPTPLGKK